MADKPAPSSSHGAQFFILILLALGLYVLLSGKFGKSVPQVQVEAPVVVDPAVKKYIGKLKKQDALDDQDRRELQGLLDKVGK